LGWLPHKDFDTLVDRAGLAELRKKRTTLREQLQGNPGCIELMGARNELSAQERSPDELMAPLGPTVTVHDLLAVTIGELSLPRRKVVYALAACGMPVDDTTVIALLTGDVKDVEVGGALEDLTRNQLVSKTSAKLYNLSVDNTNALLPPAGEERAELLLRAADELGKRRVVNSTGPDQLRTHFAQLQALLTAERYGVAYDVIDDMIDFVNKWELRIHALPTAQEDSEPASVS